MLMECIVGASSTICSVDDQGLIAGGFAVTILLLGLILGMITARR